MPWVTATAACLGLRPVAKAFGWLRRNHVEAGHRHPGRVGQLADHLVQARLPRSPRCGCARLILSAILSENQYVPMFMTAPITRNVSAMLGPPISAPITTSMPVSVASRSVVLMPAFQTVVDD